MVGLYVSLKRSANHQATNHKIHQDKETLSDREKSLAKHQDMHDQSHQTARMPIEALDKITSITTPSQSDTGLVEEGQKPSTVQNARNDASEVTGDDASVYNPKQSNAQKTDQHVRNMSGPVEEQSSESPAEKQRH